MGWTSFLNPSRSFPAYAGPHPVGSLDVEIPVTELEESTSSPAADITTVLFRIFYPCESGGKKSKPVRWLPDPQRPYFGGFARFLGAGPTLADTISYLTPHLYYITIPVQRNAPILKPETSSGSWPVLVFSHGLGGSRNAYSHILGSLASHGMVVVAVEHRDGSGPISFIRATASTEPRTIQYRPTSHSASPAAYAARDDQLKIRLWEVSLVHDALLKIDSGQGLTALGYKETSTAPKTISGMAGALDVHRPGRIIWAGHSFGAATTVQFVKSVYWRCPSSPIEGYTSLYTPPLDSPLIKQITPESPVILLDLWAMPLRSPSTKWLWRKPMPSYDDSRASACGGATLLAILSEAFFKWPTNLNDTRRVLGPPASGSRDGRKEFVKPRFFYPINSAHLSQSDFGVLFPWFTRRIFGAMEPERVVRLNARAILQTLRECKVDVAETKTIDAEERQEIKQDDGNVTVEGRSADWKIFAADGSIRGWTRIDTEAEMEEEESD